MTRLLYSLGFDSIPSFVDSVVHPTSLPKTAIGSVALASLGTFFEAHVGIAPAIGIVILLLFVMELFTGIRASKLEGHKFESRKFQKGFVKMFLYNVMIGIAHTLEQHIIPRPLLGFEINIYEWLHYFFLNFTILQLIVSNIENFNRLGWDDFVPAIGKIGSFLNIRKKGKDLEDVNDMVDKETEETNNNNLK